MNNGHPDAKTYLAGMSCPVKESCPHLAPDDADTLRLAVPWMRHEFDRFCIPDRPRTLANLILTLTWEDGLPSIWIPKLDYFTQLTGIAVPNVINALQKLELMRVIRVEPKEAGKRYSLNALTDTWQAEPRQARETIDAALHLLRELNGQPRKEAATLNFPNGTVSLFLPPQTLNLIGTLKSKVQEIQRAKGAKNTKP